MYASKHILHTFNHDFLVPNKYDMEESSIIPSRQAYLMLFSFEQSVNL
jgi:hypothetical protein